MMISRMMKESLTKVREDLSVMEFVVVKKSSLVGYLGKVGSYRIVDSWR